MTAAGDRTARLAWCLYPSHQEEDRWFVGVDRLPLGRHDVACGVGDKDVEGVESVEGGFRFTRREGF